MSNLPRLRDELNRLFREAAKACTDVNADTAWPRRSGDVDELRSHEDFMDVLDGIEAGIEELEEMTPDLLPPEQEKVIARLGALRQTRNWKKPDPEAVALADAKPIKPDPDVAIEAMAIASTKLAEAEALMSALTHSG